MSVKENVRVIDQVDAAGNARDWDLWLSLHDPAVYVDSPELPEPITDRQAHLEQVQALITTAFPDARLERHRIFGEGEWLCAEYTVTGTHRGPLGGADGTFPATNRQVVVPYCTVYRVREGRIREERTYYNLLDLLRQLGMAP